MAQNDAGKGSFRRNAQIDEAVFESNWERIFGKAKPKEETQKKADCPNQCPGCTCSNHGSSIGKEDQS